MLLLPNFLHLPKKRKFAQQHIAFQYFSPASLPKWLLLYKPNFWLLLIRIASLILGRSPRYIVTTEQNSAVLPTFVSKSPSFGHSYRSRNILPIFVSKSPSFGHSYRSRNILPRFVSKSPLFLIEQINPAKQKYKITVIVSKFA